MSAVLQDLRARIGALEKFSRRERFPYSALPEGLPRGGLVEIAGPGKTECVVRFLAENPELSAAWVEKTLSIYPPAIAQRRRGLERIFFVEAGAETAWAASTVLRSRLFPIVVYHAPYGCERELRRFQLLAEKAEATVLLLAGREPHAAWPIALSLESSGGALRVRRQK